MLQVKVWRGGESGGYQEFEVPRLESQTVLDVVTYIQRSLDSTLSYRFACRVGMCGSCAMTVNGKARWTCRTHVAKVSDGNNLEIAPLNHLPVIIKKTGGTFRHFRFVAAHMTGRQNLSSRLCNRRAPIEGAYIRMLCGHSQPRR